MTAEIRIFHPRKSKLVTPSDKWSKRKLVAHINRIVKFQAKKGKKP